MKVLVIGSGAVGCILGGALIRNGHESVFLAREKNLDTLQRRGLVVQWPDETWTFSPVRAIRAEDPAESFDIILFCVKGYDWESASALLSHFSAPHVLTFQNGVYVHAELSRRLTSSTVHGSVIYVAADRIEPGIVGAKASARVVLDGSSHVRPWMEALAQGLSVDQVKVQLSDNIDLDLWRKYLFLCSFSAVNTLTEKPVSAILNDPEVRDLWSRMMREIVAVGNAAGIKLAESDVETALINSSKFPPGTSSSLLADTLRKQKTEVELLQGNLVRLASKLRVEIPVSRTCITAEVEDILHLDKRESTCTTPRLPCALFNDCVSDDGMQYSSGSAREKR